MLGRTRTHLFQHHIGRIIEAATERLSGAELNLLENATNSSGRPVLQGAGDYEGHVDEYAFKSHGVIEMLKKLLQDFEGQLVDTHRAETNAANVYELARGARQNLVQAASDSKTEKEESRNGVQTRLRSRG